MRSTQSANDRSGNNRCRPLFRVAFLLLGSGFVFATACVVPPDGNDNDPPANKNENAPKANENDNDAAPPGSEENPIPPDSQRFTIQSQCGQLIIQCTSDFPGPMVELIPMEGQRIAATEDGGYVIEDVGEQGIEPIQLAGIRSDPGSTAAFVQYEWSYGATDLNPCTLEPGPTFSVEENPLVYLAPGVHYIRLTVANDIQRASVATAECGTLAPAPAADFLEIEIEVR